MAKKYTARLEGMSYTPRADRDLPEAERSVFRFRALTQAERLSALDDAEVVHVSSTGERTVRQRSFSQARELVLLTLESADNFPAGGPVQYPRSGSAQERSRYLEMIGDALMYELGNAVFDHSTLGEPEKNFSTPSPTQS